MDFTKPRPLCLSLLSLSLPLVPRTSEGNAAGPPPPLDPSFSSSSSSTLSTIPPPWQRHRQPSFGQPVPTGRRPDADRNHRPRFEPSKPACSLRSSNQGGSQIGSRIRWRVARRLSPPPPPPLKRWLLPHRSIQSDGGAPEAGGSLGAAATRPDCGTAEASLTPPSFSLSFTDGEAHLEDGGGYDGEGSESGGFNSEGRASVLFMCHGALPCAAACVHASAAPFFFHFKTGVLKPRQSSGGWREVP